MLEGLAGKVQAYSTQIVVATVVITILFSGLLPQIKILTNWEEFYPDNEVASDFDTVNNNFGMASKYHHVYVEPKENGNVLSPAALREQYNITIRAEVLLGVEDVISVAEFINQGCLFLSNGSRNILNTTDMDIEFIKNLAVEIYKANFTQPFPIDIDLEEVQRLMATLLPSDFNPAFPWANSTLIVVLIYGAYDEPDFKEKSLEIRDTLNNMQFEYIQIHQTSAALLTHEVDQTVWETTLILGVAAFILIIVLLFVSFRDYTYVLLPFTTLIMVAIWTFGTMVLLSIKFTVVEVAVLPLIVGLGIDYSVHISRRYQEEMSKGKDITFSLKQSVKMVGSALSLAVLTTIIAFFSFVFSEITPVRNFGILVGLGIFNAFFLTITFQIAARYILDSRRHGRVLIKRKEPLRILKRGMSFGAVTVKKYSVPVLGIVLILTGLAIFAANNVETEFSLEDFVPEDWTTMRTTNIIRHNFASSSYTREYILLEGNITEPELLNSISLMEENIAGDKYVVFVQLPEEKRVLVESIRKFTAEAISRNQSLGENFNVTNSGIPYDNCTAEDIHGIFYYLYNNQTYLEKVKSVIHYNTQEERFDAALIRVFVSAQGTSEAREMYKELKEDVVQTQEIEIKVTGETVLVITTIDSFQRSQVISTAISVILSALVLMLVYRSFSLGIIAVVPVAISTIWILGTMFLLGISINVFTVMVTALTIGLGIDYSIHITERYREERKMQDPRKSMQTTIERTGSAILISALTTICGFAVLFLSPMPLTQHFGIITAATIIYSFILAVFVLPILLVTWALVREKKKKIK